MAARCLTKKLSLLALRPAGKTHVCQLLWRGAFFSRKKPPQEDEIEADVELATEKRKYKRNEPNMAYNLNLLKAQRSLDTKRGYDPPDEVVTRVENVVKQLCDVKDEDWREVRLDSPRLKYKVISKLIQEFNHDMPGSILTEVSTAEDVCSYFQQKVRSTTALEDMSSLDIPKNLHIQLEYLRFDPDNDTFFEGRTAFPGRDSVVTSLKYRRKYKDAITTKDKAGYVDPYYGY